MKSFIIMLFFLLSVGCSSNRSVTLTGHQSGSDAIFEIHTTGINGILGMSFHHADATGDLLWRVKMYYFNGPYIKYGDIPIGFKIFNGSTGKANQEFPASTARPRSFLPNEQIYISVLCQYDTAFEASTGSWYFLASTDASGKITSVIPK
jgi:hypothetical protein